MIKICEKCFKVYNITAYKKVGSNIIDIDDVSCQVKKCNGKLFDCDELFAPIVALLNKKGYKTKYCCSAHIRPEEEIVFNKKYKKHKKFSSMSSYIYFEKGIILPNLPDGYKIDNSEEYTHDGIIIRKNFNTKKYFYDLFREVLNNALSVMNWVEKLEKFEA